MVRKEDVVERTPGRSMEEVAMLVWFRSALKDFWTSIHDVQLDLDMNIETLEGMIENTEKEVEK